MNSPLEHFFEIAISVIWNLIEEQFRYNQVILKWIMKARRIRGEIRQRGGNCARTLTTRADSFKKRKERKPTRDQLIATASFLRFHHGAWCFLDGTK